MRETRYLDTVRKLEARGVMPERLPSLELTQLGLERIGFYNFPFWKTLKDNLQKTIIVAGTNGKGSVCATLQTLLTSAGERVGLYTSPHLVESTERIRIGNQDISKEHFCECYEEVQSRTEDLTLSHFEVMTLMALWYFTSGRVVASVERLILEVGLGGIWDSTNAIPHGVCVITRLGLDHQNFLGPTIVDIARNKFGVISKNALVLHAPMPVEVLALASQVKNETASQWIEIQSYDHGVETSPDGSPIHLLSTSWGKVKLQLAGKRGAENTSLALGVFQALGYDPKNYLPNLAEVKWPGRMEKVIEYSGPGTIYLSGDHNPQGIQSLLTLLADYKRTYLHLIVGVGIDKDLDGILSPLFTLDKTSVYLTESPFRGRKLNDYGQWLPQATFADPTPDRVFSEMLTRIRAGEIAVVTGSLYLVGKIKSILTKADTQTQTQVQKRVST